MIDLKSFLASGQDDATVPLESLDHALSQGFRARTPSEVVTIGDVIIHRFEPKLLIERVIGWNGRVIPPVASDPHSGISTILSPV